jgi:hypothetical protein
MKFLYNNNQKINTINIPFNYEKEDLMKFCFLF